MRTTSISLLERLRHGSDERAWERLDALYRPYISNRLLQLDPTLGDDVNELVQEVMVVLVEEVPRFRRERPGSFRSWLRSILVHRLQAFWRARKRRPRLLQGTGSPFDQLIDSTSDLSRMWDHEHDQWVIRRLLELLKPEFTLRTWQAFHRVAIDGARPDDVASELEMSVNAVLLAKSHILKRMREEAAGLIK